MSTFDPNAAAPKDSGIFGLPYTIAESKLVLLPIPWEATTSYGGGTANGPRAILHASKQVDLYDLELGNFYQSGITMLDEAAEIRQWNDVARELVKTVLAADEASVDDIEKINRYSVQVNDYVYAETKKLLEQDKLVGLIGGDHSVPFGAIKATLEKYPNMSVLHFDAHADLRNAYEGFKHSHASIMYNIITETNLQKLVQVGIRDFCEEEWQFIQDNKNRILTYFDSNLNDQKMNGKTWASLCTDIVKNLSNEVYISFDIDGLDPRFCPHTGTPVPGGLDLTEALYLIKKVAHSGRKIIGFDLNEVSPGNSYLDSDDNDTAAEWDANVGARLLYKLCGWAITTNVAE